MQQWFLPYETPTYTQHTQKGVPTKPCTGHSHSRFFSGIFDWAFTNLRTNFRIPLKESIHLKPHLNEHAGLKTCPQISWPSSCQEKCDLCSSPLNLDSAFACQIKCGESDAMSLYINSGLENWQHLLLSVEMLIVGTQPPCFEEAQAAHGEPLPPGRGTEAPDEHPADSISFAAMWVSHLGSRFSGPYCSCWVRQTQPCRAEPCPNYRFLSQTNGFCGFSAPVWGRTVSRIQLKQGVYTVICTHCSGSALAGLPSVAQRLCVGDNRLLDGSKAASWGAEEAEEEGRERAVDIGRVAEG